MKKIQADVLNNIKGGQEGVDQSKHLFCCPDHEVR